MKVTGDKLELFNKLSTVEAEFPKWLEKLFTGKCAHVELESLMSSVVGQSVKKLDVFVKQLCTQPVNRFRTVVENV